MSSAADVETEREMPTAARDAVDATSVPLDGTIWKPTSVLCSGSP